MVSTAAPFVSSLPEAFFAGAQIVHGRILAVSTSIRDKNAPKGIDCIMLANPAQSILSGYVPCVGPIDDVEVESADVNAGVIELSSLSEFVRLHVDFLVAMG